MSFCYLFESFVWHFDDYYMIKFDFRLLSLSSIVFSALSALLIILFDIVNEGKQHRKLKIKLILYFISQIVMGLCFVFYFYAPNIFVWANGLLMLSMLLVPVFLYAFVYKITAIDANDSFSNYHYLVPGLLTIIMITLSLTTPVKEQLSIIKADGSYTGGSMLFFIFSNKLFFRLLFSVFYIVLSFKRIPAYRKYVVSYSSNESKSSLRWLPVFLFFMCSLIIFPLFGLFMSRSALASSYGVFIQVIILIIQHAYLAYHVVKRNYVLPEPLKDDINEPSETIIELEKGAQLKKNLLNKAQFADNMELHKFYLEPNLKITELAERIGVNRTYLSSFINTEYGMNFSVYINSLRLQEYKRLRSNENYNNKSNAELAERAGFGSYRSYTRFVALYANE